MGTLFRQESSPIYKKPAPTLSSSISVLPLLLHDNISYSGVGEWPHIRQSSGPVISPWLRCAEGRSWKDVPEWCDTAWNKKNTDSEANIPHRVQQCQLPFLSIRHPLNPVPSTMKVEQICWHWSCRPGWPNFISAGERRLSSKILTDNCIYYFLFAGQ